MNVTLVGADFYFFYFIKWGRPCIVKYPVYYIHVIQSFSADPAENSYCASTLANTVGLMKVIPEMFMFGSHLLQSVRFLM